jgi:hypothetical protein
MCAQPAESHRSHYLLVLRQPEGGVPPPEEMKKIMAQFTTWMDDLRKKEMVESTNGLELTGKVLRGRRVIDGPYAETKEIIGGYVLISASNLDEAVEAAQACPGLDYNLTVEVRPVRPPPNAQG